VLVADSVWDAIGDTGEFQGYFAGPRRLKGIKSEVELFRIRRGGDSDDSRNGD
jgi:adenylate cyclase